MQPAAVPADLPDYCLLSSEQVRTYHQDGFLVLPNALTQAELDELCAEATAICRGDRGAVEGVVPALPSESEPDILRRYLCIHFPHKISSVMTRYLAHHAIVGALRQLIGLNVKCMQSMLFIKATGKPGQAWHQDEFFIPTRDCSLNAAWLAMDDANQANGCLWVIPGSHRDRLIWPQREHNDRRFDCTGEAFQFPYADSDAVPVEVPAGSIVFFNGYLLHRSLPNRAQSGYRRVLVNHYMSAESLLPWFLPREGEHQGINDFRDIVMITGQDPYAWKGIENRMVPKVRPSGEGGCVKQETKHRN